MEWSFDNRLDKLMNELKRLAPDELLGLMAFVQDCDVSEDDVCEYLLGEIARITGESVEVVGDRLLKKGVVHV